ncbi:hypothetical protein [Rhizohabitans arisaemae]|uniref:hypothetical protein n=1 Tax=Rhizohabitans arisaemae TaxID=2720610 RepID=UPI0024B17F72|nr:hypothetical protein [Rhizohabitans arisaemae]
MDAHITNTPARARTDVGAADTLPTDRHVPITARTIRRLGLTLTACTVPWAAVNFVVGPNGDGLGSRINNLTALIFQFGLIALVTVQMRTRATGTSRVSMIMLKVELGLLIPACLWSLLHGILPLDMRDATWLAVIDLFWPLSMVGMFVISMKIVFEGRWSGIVRWWVLVAESWAFVSIPSLFALGEPVGRWVGAGYLIVGYGMLGVLLALRPELTVPRQLRR